MNAVLFWSALCMTVWGRGGEGGLVGRDRDPFWSLKTDRLESRTQWLTLHILSLGVGSGVWIHRGLKHHREHSERASKTFFLPCPNPPITDIL